MTVEVIEMSMTIYSRSIDVTSKQTRTETVWCCSTWDKSENTIVCSVIVTDAKVQRCTATLSLWTDTGWRFLFGLASSDVHLLPDRDNEDELLRRWAVWVKCGDFDPGATAAAVGVWDSR